MFGGSNHFERLEARSKLRLEDLELDLEVEMLQRVRAHPSELHRVWKPARVDVSRYIVLRPPLRARGLLELSLTAQPCRRRLRRRRGRVRRPYLTAVTNRAYNVVCSCAREEAQGHDGEPRMLGLRTLAADVRHVGRL